MSAWIPAPAPESDPATTRTRPIIQLVPEGRKTSSSLCRLSSPCRPRYRGDRGTDLIDDGGDKRLILALGHDADQRLGAGFADEQPAGLAEPSFRRRDHPL